MPETLVIIPTYNERENVRSIVDRVLSADSRIHVLVVDDNSPDGTGDMADEMAAADERVSVLHRAGKLGLGTAYLEGFAIAAERGYTYVFEFDADGSHPPEKLTEMIDALDSGAGLVIGTRWMPGGRTENWPLQRQILSRGASIYARVLLQSKIRDITAGHRGYRVELLQGFDLTRIKSAGYCFQIEMAWLFERSGIRVSEVPITFVERQEGASKMSSDIIVEAVWRVFAWGLGYRLGAFSRLISH